MASAHKSTAPVQQVPKPSLRRSGATARAPSDGAERSDGQDQADDAVPLAGDRA